MKMAVELVAKVQQEANWQESPGQQWIQPTAVSNLAGDHWY
jgi:hypothetical protein